MNAEIKAEWIKRLREYKKGEGYLCSERSEGERQWCCLGVLSDIYVEQTPGATWDRVGKDRTSYVVRLPTGEAEQSFLLETIARWAGVPDDLLSITTWEDGTRYTDIFIYIDPADPLYTEPAVQTSIFEDALGLSVLNDYSSSFDLIIKLIERYL